MPSSKNTIQLVIEMKVNEGAADALADFLQGAAEATEANDPGAVSYSFFIDETKSTAWAIEIYRDAAAMQSHMANLGEGIAKLFDLATIHQTLAMGAIPEEAKEGFAAFKPVYGSHVAGFTR